MITAPLLQTGVEIELPEVDTPNIPENKDPIIITINKNNETFISKKRVTSDMLNEKLKEIKEQELKNKRKNPNLTQYILSSYSCCILI